MKRLALLVALGSVVALPRAARADATFDGLAAGATPVVSVDGLAWALTATCQAGDDLAKRQCRLVRAAAAAALAGRTLLVDLPAGTFEVGAWDVNKKSTPIRLRGCLACDGVIVDGKRWLVTAAAPGKGSPGKAGGVLHETARTFRDDAAAVAWRQTVAPRLRAQALVRLPAGAWKPAAGAIALELSGYRVYDPCDGVVVIAQPAAASLPKDKKQCGAAPAAGAVVPELTPALISAALQPVKAAAEACHATFGVDGDAALRLVIGGDGAILSLEQQGAFVDTPTGACLDTAVRKVTFPRSAKAPTSFTYPLALR